MPLTASVFTVRLALAGFKFTYRPGLSCFYRVRPGQMTADTQKMNQGMDALLAKMSVSITTPPYQAMANAIDLDLFSR